MAQNLEQSKRGRYEGTSLQADGTSSRRQLASHTSDILPARANETRLYALDSGDESQEVDIKKTNAYNTLRFKLGLVHENGTLKQNPSYFCAWHPTYKLWVHYRIRFFDAYTTSVQFKSTILPRGDPITREAFGPSNSVAWRTWQVGPSSKAKFDKGVPVTGR